MTRTALARTTLLRRALAWLAHPVTVVAVVVLVVNDHVLKAALGTWWTGKLSDVAGVVFFPALVAVALAAAQAAFSGSASRRRPSSPGASAAFSRLVLVSTVLTGIGFAWVKATEAGAATASALLTAIAGPGVVLQDATDLLALPALALAVWAARASAREVRGGRERARRAVGIAMVPVALLASVATTAPIEPEQGIVTNEDGAWFAHIEDAYGFDGNAYYAYTGRGWEPYDEWGAGTRPPERQQYDDCVPTDPTVCFRLLPGGTGVERSDDGGEVWELDWALTADEVTTLSEAYGVDATEFTTVGVGVVETRRGFVVVASNGYDGFAVRSETGTWERVGFEGMDCCETLATADFDTVDDLPQVLALPVGWSLGLGLATLGLPFLAAMLRRGRASQLGAGASAAGVVFCVVALVAGLNVLGRNMAYAPLTRADIDRDATTYAIVGGMAVVAAIVATASFGLLRRGAVWATVVGWVLGAALVGVVAETVQRDDTAQVFSSLGAYAVWSAIYIPVARRLLVKGVGAPATARS